MQTSVCTCNILSWYYLSRLPKIHLYYIVLQYSVSILTTEDPALSLSLPLSLSLSLPLSLSPFLSIYVSPLWLQDTCHMMPFTKQHSAYAWVVTCILFLINLTFHNLPLHSSYKIHQPFTDYFLRLPYSELLEKRLFRSRANRRLVYLSALCEVYLHSGDHICILYIYTYIHTDVYVYISRSYISISITYFRVCLPHFLFLFVLPLMCPVWYRHILL